LKFSDFYWFFHIFLKIWNFQIFFWIFQNFSENNIFHLNLNFQFFSDFFWKFVFFSFFYFCFFVSWFFGFLFSGSWWEIFHFYWEGHRPTPPLTRTGRPTALKRRPAVQAWLMTTAEWLPIGKMVGKWWTIWGRITIFHRFSGKTKGKWWFNGTYMWLHRDLSGIHMGFTIRQTNKKDVQNHTGKAGKWSTNGGSTSNC
jgi:hypothetical protein